MGVRVGPYSKLNAKELMLLNCGVREDSLRFHWTTRRSNQSILKEISPGYSLQGLMLTLKFQSGHLMRRTDTLEKTLMLEMIEDKRRRGWQRMRWLYSIIDLMDTNLNKFWETLKDKGAWCAAVHRVSKSQT